MDKKVLKCREPDCKVSVIDSDDFTIHYLVSHGKAAPTLNSTVLDQGWSNSRCDYVSRNFNPIDGSEFFPQGATEQDGQGIDIGHENRGVGGALCSFCGGWLGTCRCSDNGTSMGPDTKDCLLYTSPSPRDS